MGQYEHLTISEREDIMCMRREGLSVREVARRLGRDGSTVSRELSRNSREGLYRASDAQAAADGRRLRCVRPRILDDPALGSLVQRLIRDERWSPEQVAGRVRLEGGRPVVSAATIYRAVDGHRLDPPELAGTKRGLRSRLRHRGKRRHRGGEEERRGRIRVAHDITERPAEAEARTRLGDWEADTVAGLRGGPCLVTAVDRMSGYLVGGKASARNAYAVGGVMVASLAGLPLETAAPGRGAEFAGSDEVSAALGVEFYFALPRHPWERGTNENTNGLLREYFPKGCDLSGVSDEEVAEAYDDLNHRPRKRLGYRTPYEVFHSVVLRLL